MTDHEKDRHLDELLDSALSAYSAVEPRPGLETRILANVREAAGTTTSRWRNWTWLWAGAVAGAVAGAAVLLIALWIGRHTQVQAPTNKVVRTKEPPAQLAPKPEHRRPVTAANPASHQRRERGVLRPQPVTMAVPRQPVFPAPTPLSEQEKLLLSYYAHTPREELIAQSRPDEPPVAAEDQSNIAVPEMIFVPQKSSSTR